MGPAWPDAPLDKALLNLSFDLVKTYNKVYTMIMMMMSRRRKIIVVSPLYTYAYVSGAFGGYQIIKNNTVITAQCAHK